MPVIFSLLMLFNEIIAVHCENYMEHMNELCEQSVEFLNVKYLVNTVVIVHPSVQIYYGSFASLSVHTHHPTVTPSSERMPPWTVYSSTVNTYLNTE
jgi:hypothetical protein